MQTQPLTPYMNTVHITWN